KTRTDVFGFTGCNREEFDRSVTHQSPPVAGSGVGREHRTLVCAHDLPCLWQTPAAAVLLLQPGGRGKADCRLVRERRDLETPLGDLERGDPRLCDWLDWRRTGRLLVCTPAADRGGVRSVREDGQRAAAGRAGADLHTLAGAWHLVEGRAWRHARLLHCLLQRLSGRQGSEPHRPRECAHAWNERAPVDAARLLAFGTVLDVFIAAHVSGFRGCGSGRGRISGCRRRSRLPD